jgi:hypothetical protein
MLLLSRQQIPSSGWMFKGPPLWRVLAFLGFWVRRLLWRGGIGAA